LRHSEDKSHFYLAPHKGCTKYGYEDSLQ